jgi:DnaK suppressor protein
MAQAKRPAKKASQGSKARTSSPKAARSAKATVRKTSPKAGAAKAKSGKPKAATTKAKAPVRASVGKPKARPAASVKSGKVAPAPAKQAPAKPAAASRGNGPTQSAAATGMQRKVPAPSRSALKRALEPSDPSTYIHGFRPYQPKSGESYMSTAQLDHFRQILQAWKRELMEEVDRTVHHMQDEASNFPDPNDRATQESEFGLELRTRDRERKLLKKIDAALERIEDGSYGYCEETGEEIGLRRLEARPVATLSVEAQERREMAERQYGERDDRYR